MSLIVIHQIDVTITQNTYLKDVFLASCFTLFLIDICLNPKLKTLFFSFLNRLLKAKICKHLFQNRIVYQAPFWLLKENEREKKLRGLFPIAQTKADQTVLGSGHFWYPHAIFSLFEKRSTAFSIILLCREGIFTALHMSDGDYFSTKILRSVNLTAEIEACWLTRFKEIWKNIVELGNQSFLFFLWR